MKAATKAALRQKIAVIEKDNEDLRGQIGKIEAGVAEMLSASKQLAEERAKGNAISSRVPDIENNAKQLFVALELQRAREGSKLALANRRIDRIYSYMNEYGTLLRNAAQSPTGDQARWALKAALTEEAKRAEAVIAEAEAKRAMDLKKFEEDFAKKILPEYMNELATLGQRRAQLSLSRDGVAKQIKDASKRIRDYKRKKLFERLEQQRIWNETQAASVKEADGVEVARKKVRRLWRVLGTTPEEMVAFYRKLVPAIVPSPRTLEVSRTIRQELAASRPISSLVQRRASLRKGLIDLEERRRAELISAGTLLEITGSSSPSVSSPSTRPRKDKVLLASGTSTVGGIDKQFHEINEELADVEEKIQQLIARFQRRFGHPPPLADDL